VIISRVHTRAEVSVRPAVAADARRITEVILAVGWSRDGEADPPESRWREVLADDAWWVGVAVDAGQPVGVATVKPADEMPGTGHITYLAVAPEFADRGIGGALVVAAVEEMRRRGYDRGRLRVAVTNGNARGFYEHMGWRDTRERMFHEELGLDLAEYEVEL
jgi:ribosomal protein S18 acetylase RimI-like enzyme